jgi:hypothetical protein
MQSDSVAIVDSLKNSTAEKANEILIKSKNRILNNFEQHHKVAIQKAKEKLADMEMDFNFSNASKEQKFLNKQSDLVYEARSTGFNDKIEKVNLAIKNIASLREANVGTTQHSINLSNRINELFSVIDKEHKEVILDSSGTEIREFANKSQDNMSSMLLFTDERAIFLESARQNHMKNGNIIEARNIDQQLKGHIGKFASYDVSGIENWGANAKSGEELLENSIAAQEGQRQTRSAMLR